MSSQPKRNSLGRIFFGFAILILLGGVFLFFHSYRQLSYKGQTLNQWTVALSSSTPQWQHDEAVEAIRSMGPNALSQLLRWIDPPPTSDLMSNVDNWIDNHPALQMYLPERTDKSWQAARAFEALGPAAQPAIPRLTQLLENPERCEVAAMCLAGIGTDSLPILTNALASTNSNERISALMALASLGEKAQTAAPVVAQYIGDSKAAYSYWAILALGEFGTASEPYVPELKRMLNAHEHNDAPAFALARLGFASEVFKCFTNAPPKSRWDCAIALDRLLSFPPWKKSTSQTSFFEVPLLRENFPSNDGLRRLNQKLVSVLQIYLKVPDATFRSRAADTLGTMRTQAYPAIPLLTSALAGSNELVRVSASNALSKIDVQVSHGGIVRGPRGDKKIALEFTGHTFAEGGETILNELGKHNAKASFFLTGDFLDNPEFAPLVHRMVEEGHYLGPHSGKHLLYCSWEDRGKTLVSRQVFRVDLSVNLLLFRNFITHANGPSSSPSFSPKFWLPAYEWYNQEIADWSRYEGLTLINFTPGTRSNADYTQESDSNFVSSQAIFDSIVKKEKEDPRGLNGFLLLMHLGAGPGRKDKMHERFGELLDYLSGKGYEFVRIDDLLDPPAAN